MDKAAVREIVNRFANEVLKTLKPQTMILFGSYVNGNPHEYSDIDVAVVFNDFQGDWLEVSSYLVGLAWDVGGYIEPHMMDTASDHSGFLEYIRKNGEIIYES